MTKLSIDMQFPLHWVAGRPRTLTDERKEALFRDEGRRMSLDSAIDRLDRQMDMITPYGRNWRTTGLVCSTNIRFTQRGTRDRNYGMREPEDPGVAFYFRLDGHPHALACDRWTTVADNIAAIAAHIEALRGQERWGVADLKQAFAGHVALPPPDPWWKVLGVSPDASLSEIEAAFRHLAKQAHADAGGSDAAMVRLNLARDAARKDRT
ncbi:MAG: J domain-containing protein [Blastomonas fulva]|uniref:J domain-containing protein n=1 Tax=Blastomonas fulva TaxID=1550728 RepID=UPI0024E1D0F5|nr:J domain-containing protein [Blastomonas fulva]MDK2757515.1 J domain-containing protein [Blastomonas fulva]